MQEITRYYNTASLVCSRLWYLNYFFREVPGLQTCQVCFTGNSWSVYIIKNICFAPPHFWYSYLHMRTENTTNCMSTPPIFFHGYGRTKKKIYCAHFSTKKWNNILTKLSIWGEYFQDLHITQPRSVKTKVYFFSCLIVLNNTLCFFTLPHWSEAYVVLLSVHSLQWNNKCLSKMEARDIMGFTLYLHKLTNPQCI